jgi:4-hydroxybenzoate polyprenyltransferase
MNTINMIYSNKIIKRITEEFIYGGHLVSLISPAFFLSVAIIMNLPINFVALMTAYLIPLIVYSYNYQSELDNDYQVKKSDKYEFIVKRKKIYPILLSLDIIVLIVLSIMFLNYGFVFFTLILITGGILYTVVFKVLTRNIIGFKNIYVDAIWAYAGMFFVVFYYSLDFTLFYILFALFIFVKILINNIFFDIKDLEVDKIERLITIPVILGRNTTINLLHIINLLILIALVTIVYMNIFPFFMLSLGLTNIYVFFYLEKSRNADDKKLLRFTYLIADSEFLLWPLLLLIGKLLFPH